MVLALFFLLLYLEIKNYVKNMILIADSGSTKTDWAVLTSQPSILHSSLFTLHSQGLNPVHQSRDTILQILRTELLPQFDASEVSSVFFYGSGVRPELESVMADVLREAFPQAETVEAHSDLLGAARALCGHNYGIASILGTGANSCLYDGQRIVQNTPAMGYILDDEGSGAALGKRLLHDLYKGVLLEKIKNAFETETGLSLPEIIDKVYRQPLHNRFLASLSTFIHRHLDEPDVRQMTVDSLAEFFTFNIVPYRRPDLPVSFVGSIAFFFQSELREAAEREGFALGTVLRSPIEGLIRYHSV